MLVILKHIPLKFGQRVYSFLINSIKKNTMKKLMIILFLSVALLSCSTPDLTTSEEPTAIEVVDTLSVARHNNNNTLSLTENTVIDGDVDVKSIRLNSHKLWIKGDLKVKYLTVDGKIHVEGDVKAKNIKFEQVSFGNTLEVEGGLKAKKLYGTGIQVVYCDYINVNNLAPTANPIQYCW